MCTLTASRGCAQQLWPHRHVRIMLPAARQLAPPPPPPAPRRCRPCSGCVLSAAYIDIATGGGGAENANCGNRYGTRLPPGLRGKLSSRGPSRARRDGSPAIISITPMLQRTQTDMQPILIALFLIHLRACQAFQLQECCSTGSDSPQTHRVASTSITTLQLVVFPSSHRSRRPPSLAALPAPLCHDVRYVPHLLCWGCQEPACRIVLNRNGGIGAHACCIGTCARSLPQVHAPLSTLSAPAAPCRLSQRRTP